MFWPRPRNIQKVLEITLQVGVNLLPKVSAENVLFSAEKVSRYILGRELKSRPKVDGLGYM